MLFNRKFIINILQTSGVSVLNAGSSALLLFLLPVYITSKSELALYFSFKALVASLLVMFRYALDLGLARYLGFYSDDETKQKIVFSSTIMLFVILAVPSVLVLLLISKLLVSKFLEGQAMLFWFVVISLFFHGLYRLVYTYYQGKNKITSANIIHFVTFFIMNMIIILLLVVRVIDSSLKAIYAVSFMFSTSVIPILIILKKEFIWKFEFRELIEYNLPRIPHLVLSGMLISANVLLAKLYYDNNVVGDFGITTRIFYIVGTIAYAFNMVLLPKVSEMYGQAQIDTLRESIAKYIDVIFLSGTLAVFLFYTLFPQLLLFLPDTYRSAAVILKIFAFSILPFTIYIMLRNVIHGVDKKPIQLYIDLSSFFVLFLVFYMMRFISNNPLIIISLAMFFSLLTSGLFSVIYLKAKLNVNIQLIKWGGHFLAIVALIIFSEFFIIPAMVMFILFEWWFILKYYPFLTNPVKAALKKYLIRSREIS